MIDEGVAFDGTECVKETSAALCVRFEDGTEKWVPKSTAPEDFVDWSYVVETFAWPIEGERLAEAIELLEVVKSHDRVARVWFNFVVALAQADLTLSQRHKAVTWCAADVFARGPAFVEVFALGDTERLFALFDPVGASKVRRHVLRMNDVEYAFLLGVLENAALTSAAAADVLARLRRKRARS